MATYSTSIRNGTGTIHLEIRQESQSIANNTSTVYYRLYIQGKGGYGFWNKYHTGKTSVVINGTTVHNQSGRDFDIRNGGIQQLASGTTSVKHNEDGTKSFSFSASLWSSSATGSISGSFTLSKIPRKSDFYVKNDNGSGITRFYAGDKIKVQINKKVSSFTHTLSIKYLDKEETLISKTSSSTIYYSNSNKIMENYMQDLRSMPIDFVLNTYDGSTRIGYVVKRLTIDVPSSASPTINSVNVTEANQNKINIIGETPFYQLLSDLNVITNASGKYGASIKNISVSLGNLTRAGSNVVLENINLKGDQNIKVTVQDSRGFSASTTKTINLSPYNLPNISFFNAYRTETNTKYASARISLTSTVIDNKNPLEVKVDVAEKDSSSWRNVYSATVGNGAFNSTISLGGGFDDYKAYDVRLSIADKFKRHQAISSIPTTSQSLVIGANKPVVGIGKVPEIDKGLEVDGIVKINSDQRNALYVESLSSAGTLIMLINNGKQVGWIGNFGEGLTIGDDSGADIRISNSIRLNGDIKAYNGDNDKKIIKLNPLNGLSGNINARKDPLGGVTVWGAVTISNMDYIYKNTKNWAVLPEGYRPNTFTGFSLNGLKSGIGSVVVQGMGCNSSGEIYYKGIKNIGNELSDGFNCYFSFYFKAQGAL